MHDVADDLLDLVVVVGPDLVQLVGLACIVHYRSSLPAGVFELAKVFLPVRHAAVVHGEPVLATMTQLFWLHLTEFFTVKSFV